MKTKDTRASQQDIGPFLARCLLLQFSKICLLTMAIPLWLLQNNPLRLLMPTGHILELFIKNQKFNKTDDKIEIRFFHRGCVVKCYLNAFFVDYIHITQIYIIKQGFQ